MVETRSTKKSTKSNKRKNKIQAPTIVSPTATPSKEEKSAVTPVVTPAKRTNAERETQLSSVVSQGKGVNAEKATQRRGEKTNANSIEEEATRTGKKKALQKAVSRVDDAVLVTKSSWSDRSNVGNLSIREKLCLSVVIFCSTCFTWGICLSFSVCGTTAPTIPEYIENLTICTKTWSTLAWLTEQISGNESMAIPLQELQTIRDELVMCEESQRSLHQQISTLQDSVEQEREEIQRLMADRLHSEREIKNLKKELEELKLMSKTVNKTFEEFTSSCKSKEMDLQIEKQLLSKDLALSIRERDDTQRKLYALEQTHLAHLAQLKATDSNQEEKKRRNPFTRLFKMNGMIKS